MYGVITKDDKAQLRPVEVGSWIGQDWLITNGLQDGDRVVTEGMMLLATDAPVKVLKEVDQAKPDTSVKSSDSASDAVN